MTIEREGVGRARSAGLVADLVLVVCDVSTEPTQEDADVLSAVEGARVVVLNKCDRGVHPSWVGERSRACFRPGEAPVTCSLESREGLDMLRAAIRHALGRGGRCRRA